jgi:protein-disulfide isomerase
LDKRFLGILAGIAVIFVGIFLISQQSSNGTKNNSSSASATNHVEGQGSSGVKLVEYGDYECPVCETYYQPVKDAVGQLSSQIYFQFRNLPLTSIHPNAFAGARAAEAASLQNKFWQMHDALYEHQTDWATSSSPKSFFDQYAKNLSLNVTKFDQDYIGSQVNDSINADLSAFTKTGQSMATPTFFLDGQYLNNSQLIDSSTGQPSSAKIVSVLKAEISKKTSK